MKKALEWLLKCTAAGCVALIIACAFSFFFYNTGRHISNSNGATDYLWEGNKFYCQMREGFSFGVTDADGFNNAYPGVTSDSDILIMGSSHMEAVQVMPNQSTAYLLNQYLDEASAGITAYNIGLSSHGYYRCADNFEAALEAYSPSYVILETYEIPCIESSALKSLNGIYDEVPSHDGFLYNIQAIPLPKLLLQQLREYQSENSGNNFSWVADLKESLSKWVNIKKEINADDVFADANASQNAIGAENTRLIEALSDIASQHGAKFIIVYHPTLWLQSDGTVSIQGYDHIRKNFIDVCRENGIIAIDMTERFMTEYNENSILPHGFSNSSPAKGHLNVHGHRMIAEELYAVISEMQRNAK